MIVPQRPSGLGAGDDNDSIEEIFGTPKRFATFESSYSDDDDDDDGGDGGGDRHRSAPEGGSSIWEPTASTSSHSHKKRQQHRYSISSGLSGLPAYTALAIKEASTAELSSMMMRSPSSSSGARYRQHKKSNSMSSYGAVGAVPTETDALLSRNYKTGSGFADELDNDDDSSSKADSSVTVEEKSSPLAEPTARKQAANTFGSSSSEPATAQTELSASTSNSPESSVPTAAIASTVSNNGTTINSSTHSIPSTMNYSSNASANQSITRSVSYSMPASYAPIDFASDPSAHRQQQQQQQQQRQALHSQYMLPAASSKPSNATDNSGSNSRQVSAQSDSPCVHESHSGGSAKGSNGSSKKEKLLTGGASGGSLVNLSHTLRKKTGSLSYHHSPSISKTKHAESETFNGGLSSEHVNSDFERRLSYKAVSRAVKKRTNSIAETKFFQKNILGSNTNHIYNYNMKQEQLHQQEQQHWDNYVGDGNAAQQSPGDAPFIFTDPCSGSDNDNNGNRTSQKYSQHSNFSVLPNKARATLQIGQEAKAKAPIQSTQLHQGDHTARRKTRHATISHGRGSGHSHDNNYNHGLNYNHSYSHGHGQGRGHGRYGSISGFAAALNSYNNDSALSNNTNKSTDNDYDDSICSGFDQENGDTLSIMESGNSDSHSTRKIVKRVRSFFTVEK